MPDLPGTTLEIDYAMVQHIFQGDDCQLDYCKIYPCLDLPYTKIRDWKHSGKWKPIAERNIRESCKKYWRKHVEEGGSIWTIFTEDGWQKSPSECIKFKKNVQNKVRHMFREAEKYMFIHIVDEPVGSEGSVSTIPTEEEYWKH
jgi:histone acetyltransferase (RNA polymerase elongator complex component)